MLCMLRSAVQAKPAETSKCHLHRGIAGMTGCLVVKGVDAVKYVNAKTVDPDLWPPKCAPATWRLQ